MQLNATENCRLHHSPRNARPKGRPLASCCLVCAAQQAALGAQKSASIAHKLPQLNSPIRKLLLSAILLFFPLLRP